MKAREVVEKVKAQQDRQHFFIKSWDKEKRFVDYERIDLFMNRVKDDAVEGFELLGMEQMWQDLTALDPDNLVRVKNNNDEMIQWTWSDADGTRRTKLFPFSPEGIMAIMDEELFS